MKDSSDSAHLQMSTLRQLGDVEDEVPSVRVLTILCHPDLSRVGERARLDDLARGSPVSLSRLEPRFVPLNGGSSRPLVDPCLSRRPLTIAVASPERLTLTPVEGEPADVEVDGQPLTAPLTVADHRGVVLQLSRRIVLLLHREPLARQERPGLGLVGDSYGLEVVRGRILDVAPSMVPVLVRGESGTGKELVAQAIHANSARPGGPLVAINLGALTPALAMSELFGHVRGAFTDARDSKLGLFAKADGGTLFLDEVGKASPEVQAALLRVIETGEVSPVGSDRPRRVDVRIVSATDSNLEQAIVDGEFSQALFHRLAGYEIHLPPLRERVDDTGRLLVHFLRASLAQLGAADKLEPPVPGGAAWLPAPLVASLARYPWPGNVRELRNAATQIALSGRHESQARLSEELRRKFGAPAQRTKESATNVRPSEITAAELLTVLRDSDWNLVRVAKILSISRTSLYALISKHDVGKRGDVSTDEIVRCREECGGNLDLMTLQLRIPRRALESRLTEIDRR
jgi:two-component system nitrogen regulation response regulator GlnG